MGPKGNSEWKACVSSDIFLMEKQRIQLDNHYSDAVLSCASWLYNILFISLCEKVGEVGNLHFLKTSG